MGYADVGSLDGVALEEDTSIWDVKLDAVQFSS